MIFVERKKIFLRIAVLAVLCVCIFPMLTQAAKKQKSKPQVRDVCYFQSQMVKEKGKSLLRIEVGLSKSKAEYFVHDNPKKSKQLIVEIPYARGNSEIVSDETLDGKLARYMTVREKKIKKGKEKYRQLEIMVAMTREYADRCFRVYTMPADKKKGKPYRLVIDISDSAFIFGLGTVEGVKNKVIIVDPGHGGIDSGARGNYGTLEKDVNLMVSLRVRDILEASGAKCVMTRDDDVDVFARAGGDAVTCTDTDELQARVDVGLNTPGADIFVSIHSNASPNGNANGSSTYYYAKTDYDELLAAALQQSMVKHGGLRDIGIIEERFYVCRHSEIPAALVEMAFISNVNEEVLLWSDDFQDKMAIGIAEGIGRFFIDSGI